jgi:hypothetical protein
VPVPASQDTIVCYVAYLARCLNSSSIPNYLNVIRILHLEAGYVSPLEGNFELDLLKRGIRRENGKPPNQKAPITLDILLKLHEFIDLESPADLAFWAAALIAFFGFLRKSSLLPPTAHFDEKSTLLRSEVLDLGIESFVLLLRFSKVIQFGQKVLKLPYTMCLSPSLCPVRALLSHFGASPLGPRRPLFSFMSHGHEVVLTQQAFVSRLKGLLVKVGLDSSIFSAHSFRRGGASYAFQLDLSPLQIKLRGDWSSEAYKRYVFILTGDTHAVVRAFSTSVVGQ